MARIVAERADTLPGLIEAFREHGYAGASLSTIGAATGLGRGSLYHFFPGGKREMAEAVLADIAAWFEASVFTPLADAEDPRAGIEAMMVAIDRYFQSGRRACLMGAWGLGATRDPFAEAITGYFQRWIAALQAALMRGGVAADHALTLAQDVVGGIQGAITLSRALDDPGLFRATLGRLTARLYTALASAG
ncbi:TetR/AcrR family transcriptional regulator [Sphingomonas pseudosanguinis]|uniref:AcrR family transcriptional regulator n=1 Tax=Sphingomonas pseudosanguinis TaxID=413712 RepID=A0A7W6A8Y1_9SPHN|nr:TetR/AcrR family transcriptional regulator [Sphingomonas pseudosanguinis]MBB3877698.1 AcrR family transcriptional regulator [Sphingomonas pseudosanguinis]